MTKFFALLAILLAGITIFYGFTQQSALVLRQEKQDNLWTRYDTQTSGSYRRGVWVASPTRQTYGSFRGGGPGAGK
ncbi:MAG: hypothetical protein DCF22_08810 [Leptolyngbya sp.]|nr:MAG: hypothetical protein DCF22_08810 [Leptolyngbya sp.]